MKEVILFGAGKSIRKGIELGLYDKIKDKEVWSLNYAFTTLPYLPSREIWVDFSFFRKNSGKLQLLHDKGVSLYTADKRRYGKLADKIHLQSSTRQQELTNKDVYYKGENGLVGFFGLSMACEEGYSPIYLLGYDYGVINVNDKDTHYYQGKLQVKSSGVANPHVYLNGKTGKPNKHLKCFDFYRKYDSEIINVSPKSHIYQFPKITYEEFFKKIK
jgi:hypothetical protein